MVDGDQALWVRLRSGHELIVLGVIGEPFLRIGGSGVFVNTRSPTAQIDKVGGSSVKPSFQRRSAAPRWRRVASGCSYRWHDHRLHALASLGGAGPARRLGSWTIPLRLDGGAAAIRGGLWYRPAPDVWLWLLIPLMFVVGAVVVLRSGDVLLARRATMWLAARGGGRAGGGASGARVLRASDSRGRRVRLLRHRGHRRRLGALPVPGTPDGLHLARRPGDRRRRRRRGGRALWRCSTGRSCSQCSPPGSSARASPLRSGPAWPPHCCACLQGWRTRRKRPEPEADVTLRPALTSARRERVAIGSVRELLRE